MGIEPGTFRTTGERLDHSATDADAQKIQYYYIKRLGFIQYNYLKNSLIFNDDSNKYYVRFISIKFLIAV